MSQTKSCDTVMVHYTGVLEDGQEFDSSKGKDPLKFKIGDGSLVPGFENALVGMEVGEKKAVTLPPSEAYGERQSELVAGINKENFSDNIEPKVGLQLQVKQPGGNILHVTVTNISDDLITIDANPPLAGKTLVFNIELVEIEQ